MIDLHSHILPGVDDGARSLDEALEMARMAVDDGIEVMACTPHFMPGLYDNQSSPIRNEIEHLNNVLIQKNIDLALVVGSDAHMRPDFVQCLRNGAILTLHDSRYVLYEPPHAIKPKRLQDQLFEIVAAGFVPILTHPERLKWIEQGYEEIKQLAETGTLIQLTAGSVTGRFGKSAAYWSQRMLAEGLVSILATDCHNLSSRPPLLAKAVKMAQSELGEREGLNLVVDRPSLILQNADAEMLPALPVPRKTDGGLGQKLRNLLQW